MSHARHNTQWVWLEPASHTQDSMGRRAKVWDRRPEIHNTGCSGTALKVRGFKRAGVLGTCFQDQRRSKLIKTSHLPEQRSKTDSQSCDRGFEKRSRPRHHPPNRLLKHPNSHQPFSARAFAAKSIFGVQSLSGRTRLDKFGIPRVGFAANHVLQVVEIAPGLAKVAQTWSNSRQTRPKSPDLGRFRKNWHISPKNGRNRARTGRIQARPAKVAQNRGPNEPISGQCSTSAQNVWAQAPPTFESAPSRGGKASLGEAKQPQLCNLRAWARFAGALTQRRLHARAKPVPRRWPDAPVSLGTHEAEQKPPLAATSRRSCRKIWK